jgi:hypothetical protein
VTKWLRGLRVAGAALFTLCLAWCCASCSPASRPLSSPGVVSAVQGGQLWASTLPDAGGPLGAVSPDGTTVFVSGDKATVVVSGGHRKAETHFVTVAYSVATGARLWVKFYQPGNYITTRAIAVSSDGARVYVLGAGIAGRPPMWDMAIVAYDARTGRQLWARRYLPEGGAAGLATALAVSPDGSTLYVTGDISAAGQPGWGFAVIAYAAATGEQRWLRYSGSGPGSGASVAVSPDGKTVYATGSAGSAAFTVAYRADGTMKWAARYKSPYTGYTTGDQIVVGPGGGVVYVVGRASAASGHVDIATFAYRAATGQRMWLERVRGGVPVIAVTPDGQTVIVAGPWEPGGYAIAAYNASTGGTRWTRLAPDRYMFPAGLVIGPHGDTVYIGGNRITAYSVADGTVLWITSYTRGSGVIGLSGDGTRLFGTSWVSGRGIVTVAYQT